MESFFEELNAECLEEDKHKNCNIPCVSNSVCSHEFITREYASQPYGTCLACENIFSEKYFNYQECLGDLILKLIEIVKEKVNNIIQ